MKEAVAEERVGNDASTAAQAEDFSSSGSRPNAAHRVLHVTECYAGGVSRAIDTIAKLQPEFEHYLAWTGDDTPPADGRYSGLRRLPEGMLARIRAVRSAARDLSPNVVHAHSSWAGVYTRLLPMAVPVVYEPHCYKFDDPTVSAPARVSIQLAERTLARNSAVTVVLSPHEGQLASSLSSRPVHLLPNAASVRPAEAAPATAFDPGRTIFMIGRLSPQKDPEFFREVVRLVGDQRPDLQFRWIGDGDHVERRALESAGVEVTGWVDPDQLASLLSEPGVYFHSAAYEGFPLSILDAAAFQHPIVARSIPAFDRLGIPQARTTRGCAEMILNTYREEEHLKAAVSAAMNLDATMSQEAQRNSLRALYKTLGVRS